MIAIVLTGVFSAPVAGLWFVVLPPTPTEPPTVWPVVDVVVVPPFCVDELLLFVIGLCCEGEAIGVSW